MECHYKVVKSMFVKDPTDSDEYGIAATVVYNGCTVVLTSVHRISGNLSAVTRLAKLCNQLEVSPIHLQDIVDDFLAQQ